MGDTIYFNSDRDGHFNLYAYNVPSGKTTQVTTNKVWDVRWPSSDNADKIIYELNGELQVMDTKSRRSSAISINVPDDGWRGGQSRACPNARSSRLASARRANGLCSGPRRYFQRADRKSRHEILPIPPELTTSGPAGHRMEPGSRSFRTLAAKKNCI